MVEKGYKWSFIFFIEGYFLSVEVFKRREAEMQRSKAEGEQRFLLPRKKKISFIFLFYNEKRQFFILGKVSKIIGTNTARLLSQHCVRLSLQCAALSV